MGFQDNFPGINNSAFTQFSVNATYTPTGGDPSEILVLFFGGDELDDAQWRAALQASATAWVRESDVSNPTNNDMLTVGEDVWTVTGRRKMVSGIWKIELRRDLRPTFRK